MDGNGINFGQFPASSRHSWGQLECHTWYSRGAKLWAFPWSHTTQMQCFVSCGNGHGPFSVRFCRDLIQRCFFWMQTEFLAIMMSSRCSNFGRKWCFSMIFLIASADDQPMAIPWCVRLRQAARAVVSCRERVARKLRSKELPLKQERKRKQGRRWIFGFLGPELNGKRLEKKEHVEIPCPELWWKNSSFFKFEGFQSAMICATDSNRQPHHQ